MAAKLPSTPFYCPPGRMVMGSTHEVWTKDLQGRDREKPGLFFGVAVPKTDLRCNELLKLFTQVAWNHYQHMPQQAEQIALGLKAPNFAWKVEDGDDKKNAGREGFAGCWVFRFATSIIPLKCGDNNTPPNPIDPAIIECGYYVDVSGSVAPNGLTDKNAGIYLNPNGVRLLGYGPIIQQGQSVGQMFANQPAVLPPGASALPVASAGATPGAPMPAPATPGAPPPLGSSTAAAPAPAAPPAPTPPAPPVTVLTPEQESAAIAAAAGVQHYPGFRLKADRTGYDPDPTPAPTPAVVQAVPAPAPASPVAPTPSAPALPATVAPSNPPVMPHPGFLNPTRTTIEIQAESAAMAAAASWPHTPGYRPNATRTAWEADPVA